MEKPRLFDLVMPKNPMKTWTIGQIIGMSRFDLSIGPLLKVKDLITEAVVEELPDKLDRLIREKAL